MRRWRPRRAQSRELQERQSARVSRGLVEAGGARGRSSGSGSGTKHGAWRPGPAKDSRRGQSCSAPPRVGRESTRPRRTQSLQQGCLEGNTILPAPPFPSGHLVDEKPPSASHTW